MNNKKGEVEESILHYLQKSPNARDSLEGIARWWLESVKINKSIDEVANALESLLKKGLVARCEIKGGKPIYKICKKNISS